MKQYTAFVSPPQSSLLRRRQITSHHDSAYVTIGNVISPTSSATFLADNSGALSTTGLSESSRGVYEAVLPQSETLIGMGLIVVLCFALYYVWSEQVVPVSRTKLAISKSRGEVKEYLDELKASADTLPLVGVEVVNSTSTTTDKEAIGTVPSSTPPSSDRRFERWLFTDWLKDNKSMRKGGRQKDPALPILKDAKWNSGDNPVVVAALIMMVGLIFTAFTERMSGLVQL